MDYFQQLADRYGREQLQQWGPSADKVSWDVLCNRESLSNPSKAKEISGAPIFMSRQLIELKNKSYDETHSRNKEILSALRPEDATHIPQLRVDTSGRIVDWNRSMCDLTGISKSQVVGKSYMDVLNEWVPNLTKEYKRAAMHWLTKRGSETSEYDADGCREDYLFPLPLPLQYDGSFEYVSRNTRFCGEYVELLVARLDRLPELYPRFNSHNGVPQCGVNRDTNTLGWYFDTSGWVGGMEFTLRRKQLLPSLQTLCRELVPGETFNNDGSLVTAAVAAPGSKSGGQEDVYEAISNYIRACDRNGMGYIREVLNITRQATDGSRLNKKIFRFSDDWSTHPETSRIHKYVLFALGGAEVIVQKIEKGKMTWSLAFTGKGKMDKEMKREMESRRMKFYRIWSTFVTYITPVVTTNMHSRSKCGASDSSFILPSTEQPERTLLTLKIDGFERSNGGYEEEKFKASATVQVPATLNFFQLHRVVCQAMNCQAQATRETHHWRIANIASDWNRAVTDEDCKYVQLGETYFVENGRREDYGYDDEILFNRGASIRQRISRTGAFFDQSMPLYSEKDCMGGIIRHRNVEKIFACIHSTCINSVFFEPGSTALLQDGLVKYCTKYLVTCQRIDEHAGPLPQNPEINVMQPKCIRGKPEEGDDDEYGWSVAKANKQLERDRGVLRRNLRRIGSEEYLTQMPWCSSSLRPINKRRCEKDTDIPYPLAAQVTGLDHHQMCLYGQPPLPGSDEYGTYISTLNGRIDPKFLAENVMGFMGGSFAVPFQYGKPGDVGRHYSNCGSNNRGDCIGKVWEREVDEEIRRIDSLQPKKKSKGKKRKTVIAAAKGEKTNCKKMQAGGRNAQSNKRAPPLQQEQQQPMQSNDIGGYPPPSASHKLSTPQLQQQQCVQSNPYAPLPP